MIVILQVDVDEEIALPADDDDSNSGEEDTQSKLNNDNMLMQCNAYYFIQFFNDSELNDRTTCWLLCIQDWLEV